MPERVHALAEAVFGVGYGIESIPDFLKITVELAEDANKARNILPDLSDNVAETFPSTLAVREALLDVVEGVDEVSYRARLRAWIPRARCRPGKSPRPAPMVCQSWSKNSRIFGSCELTQSENPLSDGCIESSIEPATFVKPRSTSGGQKAQERSADVLLQVLPGCAPKAESEHSVGERALAAAPPMCCSIVERISSNDMPS